MIIWEADLYRRPLLSENKEPLWELLVCDVSFQFTYAATVPQSQVDSQWLAQQLQTALQKSGQQPTQLRVFRPQSLSLLSTAAEPLGISVAPWRYTATLKQWLVQRASWYPSQPNFSGASYEPLLLEQPAPKPVPEDLWGEQWRFGSLSAQDFQTSLLHEPIPIQSVLEEWLPLPMGIASNMPIPGVIVDAGRRSMALAEWLQAQKPATLTYMAGPPDGVILEAGLVDRWVLVTFEDEQVRSAARTFVARQQKAQGLHFLLVRPDDSGMTFTGLWLLRSRPIS